MGCAKSASESPAAGAANKDTDPTKTIAGNGAAAIKLDLTGAVAVGVKKGGAGLDLLDTTSGTPVKLDAAGAVSNVLSSPVETLAMVPTTSGMIVVMTNITELSPQAPLGSAAPAAATPSAAAPAAATPSAAAPAAATPAAAGLADASVTDISHSCLLARADKDGTLVCLDGGDMLQWSSQFGKEAISDGAGGVLYAVQLHSGDTELRHVGATGGFTTVADAVQGFDTMTMRADGLAVLNGDPGVIALNAAGVNVQVSQSKALWLAS